MEDNLGMAHAGMGHLLVVEENLVRLELHMVDIGVRRTYRIRQMVVVEVPVLDRVVAHPLVVEEPICRPGTDYNRMDLALLDRLGHLDLVDLGSLLAVVMVVGSPGMELVAMALAVIVVVDEKSG